MLWLYGARLTPISTRSASEGAKSFRGWRFGLVCSVSIAPFALTSFDKLDSPN